MFSKFQDFQDILKISGQLVGMIPTNIEFFFSGVDAVLKFQDISENF